MANQAYRQGPSNSPERVEERAGVTGEYIDTSYEALYVSSGKLPVNLEIKWRKRYVEEKQGSGYFCRKEENQVRTD